MKSLASKLKRISRTTLTVYKPLPRKERYAYSPLYPRDLDDIISLFKKTVHYVNARDYSPQQLAVWAPDNIDTQLWAKSLLENTAFVAVLGSQIVGFGDIEPQSGYLDRLYVHHAHQGEGVASALCDKLESATTANTVTTHASITARGFFEKRGYTVICTQEVLRSGVVLTNYKMEKQL